MRGVDRVVGDQSRKRGERGVARMMANAKTNSPRFSLLGKNLIDSTSSQRPVCLISRLRRNLIFHTSIFQNIRPLATGTSMTMLQMLTEMIRTEEFLRIVALAEFMYSG